MASTWGMVGVIWFVQLVHYPAYRWVEGSDFVRYQTEHMRRTTWVVFPLMVSELATALWWGWVTWPTGQDRVWALAGLGLIGIAWGSTALFQVPLHQKLLLKREAGTIERLVRTNWIRTVAWTLRGVGLALWQRLVD